MSPQARITIVGLERIGASIGLALRRPEYDLEITGHDPDPIVAGKAVKIGAVHQTHWNLPAACENADVVFLALPLEEVRQTLPVIAPVLRENCVITDTTRLKMPILQWAQENLPPKVHYIGGDPLVSPATSMDVDDSIDNARADLFTRSRYCLTPSADCPAEAVKLITDLVQLLGAEPYYIDAGEHDSLVSGVNHLPLLLHLALAQTVIGNPGWRDARRLADQSFAVSTVLIDGDAASHSSAVSFSRAYLLHWLDRLGEELNELRQVIDAGDVASLQAALEAANSERDEWLADLEKGRLQELPAKPPEIPSTGEHFAQLLGFGSLIRRQKALADRDTAKKKR